MSSPIKKKIISQFFSHFFLFIYYFWRRMGNCWTAKMLLVLLFAGAICTECIWSYSKWERRTLRNLFFCLMGFWIFYRIYQMWFCLQTFIAVIEMNIFIRKRDLYSRISPFALHMTFYWASRLRQSTSVTYLCSVKCLQMPNVYIAIYEPQISILCPEFLYLSTGEDFFNCIIKM